MTEREMVRKLFKNFIIRETSESIDLKNSASFYDEIEIYFDKNGNIEDIYA